MILGDIASKLIYSSSKDDSSFPSEIDVFAFYINYANSVFLVMRVYRSALRI